MMFSEGIKMKAFVAKYFVSKYQHRGRPNGRLNL